MIAASGWNSLEIAKLCVAALVPVLLFVLSLVVARTARRVEDFQWANRKVVERRLEIYQELAPRLNDIYCFSMGVGHFSSITPADAIDRKREADRLFHTNAPLLTQAFQESYANFINTCFRHFAGVGKPAQLRTNMDLQRAQRGADWEPSWEPMFSSEWSSSEDIAAAYDAVMDRFAGEVGVRRPERRPRPWLAKPDPASSSD